MSATNFNTKNDNFRKLMGNGLVYRVPRFQRDYSWTEEEWEDLWVDIQGTISTGGEPAHYMGYLVLQTKDDKTFDVIDGQQRLTTLSLIVLAILKNLTRLIDSGQDPDRNRQRMNQIRQTYIGFLDPVTLVPRSKLTLNRNNDHYYQTYLVPLEHLPVRGFRSSEHSLRKAFEWFDRRLQDQIVKPSTEPGVSLAEFVESMSDKLFFTVITVTDELNAYKVFETLNARGVRLSATDLLKNYLFSVLHRENQHEHEMVTLETRWEKMVGRLGSESFPDFLRVHWNSRNSFVRQTELFKTVRGHIGSRDGVFELIRRMEEDVDTYMALTQPEASEWSVEAKRHARELRMFSVRQPFPLLLAAHRVLDDRDFEAILRACAVISFRYNVIGNLPTNEQERTYNSIASKVSSDPGVNASDIIRALAGIYPADKNFSDAFAEKIIRTTQSRNRRIVRYILCKLEEKLSGTPLDFDASTFNLEHVLPENPQSEWGSFSDNEVEAMVYRLGNMTLLASGINRDLANKPYQEKVDVFRSSNFKITKKLGDENVDWTPERIAARQNWMANQATSIWRINHLG